MAKDKMKKYGIYRTTIADGEFPFDKEYRPVVCVNPGDEESEFAGITHSEGDEGWKMLGGDVKGINIEEDSYYKPNDTRTVPNTWVSKRFGWLRIFRLRRRNKFNM